MIMILALEEGTIITIIWLGTNFWLQETKSFS